MGQPVTKRSKNVNANVGFNGDDNYINSIVGEGTHFRGHLQLSGLLRIDGDFSGSIFTTGKVLVGKHGRADCTIEADTVVVGGILRGAIYATEKVIVLASAMILGNIYSPRLIAEEGVLIDGSMVVRSGAASAQPPSTGEQSFSSRPGADQGRKVSPSTTRRARREHAVGFTEGGR
jgi:cytoskeletal protein CcmA (bactofilin family)